MRIAIRVDASNQIGTGHFMRCLTLAEALRERGAQIHFVCRAHVGHMIDTLTHADLPVTVLPTPINAAGVDNHAAWLGVTQQSDAADTIAALEGGKPDWLIVDHYGLDAQWERRLRPHVGELLVIDDLANRPHDCDVLLDQNYSTDAETRYQRLVPPGCRLLLGPRYALLRPEYAAYRKTQAPRDGHVRRVFVFLGGSDLANVTGMVLEAFSTPALRELEVDVVAGVNNPHRKTIERQVSQRPSTSLHGPRPYLADLMAQADLSIGAGGATTWERLCLGLPSLVVSMAENQRPACESLAASHVVHYLGPVAALQSGDIREGVLTMVKDGRALLEFSARGHTMVDGLGAQRLAEHLVPTPLEQLRLRPAQDDDAALYFDWVNEPAVRRHSLKSDSIPWQTHQEWFRSKLADPHCRLFVLEAGTLPVGQIRFDIKREEARLSYSLDPLVRGRHWAATLITMAARMVQDSLAIALCAEVKETNHASCAVFIRLGFEEQPSPHGMRVFRSVFSRDRRPAEGVRQ